MSNSRAVTSNQADVHEKLAEKVTKHAENKHQKPISESAKAAFSEFVDWYGNNKEKKDLVLDLGCGTGISTMKLAKKYPKKIVLGVDRSIKRTEKAPTLPENAKIVRADMWEVISLLIQYGFTPFWAVFFFYPNPYPKKSQFNQRIYGNAGFPELVKHAKEIAMRTNWAIGAREMQKSLQILNKEAHLAVLEPQGGYISRFEEKYAKSGQVLWRVKF